MTGDWLVGTARDAAARRRILESARQLFVRRGFDGVGMDAIARRAGCSRATVYRHVGGKHEIIEALVSDGSRRIAASVSAALEGVGPAERATVAILAAVRAIRRDPALRAWLSGDHGRARQHDPSTSAVVRSVAHELTGLDDDAVDWVYRVVMALVSWPLEDEAAEERVARRFLQPVLTPPR